MRDMRDSSTIRPMTTQITLGDVPTTEQFGARLALIRWRQRWNQKEAALACGIPQNSWREWEVSGRAPRNVVEVASKISQVTGIDDYWILTGKQNSPTPDGGGAAEKLPRSYSKRQPAG